MVETMQKHYMTDHILFIFGDDFRYQEAQNRFEQVEKLISYMQSKFKGKYDFHISTMSDYLDAVKAEAKQKQLVFPTLNKELHEDMFPYVDSYPFDYWTGYYSLRPKIKELTRQSEALVRASEHLVATNRLMNNDIDNAVFDKLISARRNLGIMMVC